MRWLSAPFDQSATGEPLQGAADLCPVEAQRPRDLRRRRIGPVRKLIEDARLAERERALVELGVQQAEPAGVQPVEGAQGSDVLFVMSVRHFASPIVDSINTDDVDWVNMVS